MTVHLPDDFEQFLFSCPVKCLTQYLVYCLYRYDLHFAQLLFVYDYVMQIGLRDYDFLDACFDCSLYFG